MSFTVSTNEKFYCFDDIIVDSENFRVQKDGKNLTLTPRAFDVLLLLLKHNNRVVEKQEIFDSVWKNTFVSDNALTKIIKEIRHALQDPADKPRYIETITKRGYRFIGEIKENSNQNLPETENDQGQLKKIAEPPKPVAIQRFAFSKTAAILFIVALISVSALGLWLLPNSKSAETSPSQIRSIAVLPFKPLNAESRDESLELGMAETLITRLGELRQITVRPISSVRKYADSQQNPVDVGREIQAEAVLDGSIQKSGERIRVTVRLINVRTGISLWSEQFDEDFTDIFKVQDSIAERVANALPLQLSIREKEQLTKHYTNSPEAYQLYLQGQLLWHRRRENWIKQSLSYFQQALEIDPNFALAHIGVADCYIMMSGHRRISMQKAEEMARPSIMKALEIDNTLAQAHNALAELKYQYEFDWKGADKEFNIALDLNPNAAWIRQAYGWFLMSAARFDEATVQMEKARELDPSSLTINIGRGRLFYYSRQYDQALQHFQNIAAVEPNDSGVFFSLYTIYEQKQMYPEAVEAYLKAMSLNNSPPERIEEFRDAFRTSGWNGFLRKQLEDLEKKAKIKMISPFGLASLYVRLGQKEEAFVWFKKTFERPDPAVLQFKIEPAYDSLRNDPRYAELIGKIGLQP